MKDAEDIKSHPWIKTIKPGLAPKIKYAHNSIYNICYPCNPAIRKKKQNDQLVQFTVIGNRVAKEFIYCSHIVRGLHKYRSQVFDRPKVHGLTSVEWYDLLNELKIYYGSPAYCLDGQVAVIVNDKFLGGEKELRAAVKEKYHYHISLNYQKEAEENFVTYIRCSGRPCVYMHISINDDHIGTLIFMLYAEVVPKTCENFVRLCETRKGGYSGTPVHRIVKDCWIQCGGYGLKSTNLDCENYIVPHDKRGVLVMANDGRNVDCSTQFVVLLQPAQWMAYKYVAFGQLIEGEETLKRIESVPTWYESPTSKILIYRAGILNVETPDVEMKNRTKEYLQGHVEDLVKLGELLYEELLSSVFQSIDMETVVSEEFDQEASDLISDKLGTGTMRAAQRFIRHKNELEDITESQSDGSKSNFLDEETRSATEELHEQDTESCKMSEEKSVLGDENVHYTSEAGSDIKPERPFVVPFTDLPYPGEVDSTFDLIKFLKGDYCFESDLVTATGQKKYIRKIVSMVSNEPSYKYSRHSHHPVSEVQLDSENEKDVKEHLRLKERVSFAGSVIENIARASWTDSKHDLFENMRKSDMIGGVESEQSKSRMWPTLEERASCACDPDCCLTGGSSSSGERTSPFAHLYKDSLDIAPVFKNQPLTETKDTRTSHLKRNQQLPIRSDRPIRSSIRITSLDRVLNLQHGKTAAHKISSDYVKTIDQMENEMGEHAVGFTEVKRYRPTLTVSEYQLKNRATKELGA